MLRYLAKRELRTALQVSGYDQAAIDECCLVLQCFRDIYQAKQIKRQKLEPPTQSQLEQMCDRYNQRCGQFKLPPFANEREVRSCLEAVAQLIRDYRSSKALEKRLVDETNNRVPSLLDQLTEDEDLIQVQTAISQVFAELEQSAQATLLLELGLELRQKEILKLLGAQLGIDKQYQLVRKIQRFKREMLIAFLRYLQPIYPEEIPTDKQAIVLLVDQLQAAWDKCINQHCRSVLTSLLASAVQQETAVERRLLQLHYQHHLLAPQVAAQLHVDPDEVISRVDDLTRSLRTVLRNGIEAVLDLNTSWGNSIDSNLEEFVKTWLENQAALDS